MAIRLPGSDEWVDDFPRQLDLLSSRKGRVPTREDFGQHVLVSVRQRGLRKARVVEPHPGRQHLEFRAGSLRADAKRDAFVWLDPDHDQRWNPTLAPARDAQHW